MFLKQIDGLEGNHLRTDHLKAAKEAEIWYAILSHPIDFLTYGGKASLTHRHTHSAVYWSFACTEAKLKNYMKVEGEESSSFLFDVENFLDHKVCVRKSILCTFLHGLASEVPVSKTC